MSTRSSKDRTVAPPARLPWRGVLARNPSGVLTTICMLLVVVWSHVVFYQSTIVRLPSPTKTSLPHQIKIRTPAGQLNDSTSSQSSSGLNWTAAAAKRNRKSMFYSYSKIIIRNRSAIRPEAAGERPRKVDVAFGTYDGTRVNVSDRNESLGVWNRWRRSRLLTEADNQTSASTPRFPTSRVSSLNRLLASWFRFLRAKAATAFSAS